MSGYIEAVQGVMQHVPTIVGFVSNAAQQLTKDPHEKKTKSEWNDPVCTLLALAVLSKMPQGTKICFSNHSVSFDTPGIFQGTARRFKGSSQSDLYHLTTAIFYSAIWLRPHGNADYKKIFELAKSAIDSMIKHTYAENDMTRQYLTATHKRLLEEAISGAAIVASNYDIPDLNGNRLTQDSREYWTNLDTSERKRLLGWVKKLESESETDVWIKHILGKIENVSAMHRKSLEDIIQGRGRKASDCEEVEYTLLEVAPKSLGKKAAASVESESDDENTAFVDPKKQSLKKPQSISSPATTESDSELTDGVDESEEAISVVTLELALAEDDNVLDPPPTALPVFDSSEVVDATKDLRSDPKDLGATKEEPSASYKAEAAKVIPKNGGAASEVQGSKKKKK